MGDRRHRRAGIAVAASLLFGLAGCYHYVEVNPPEVVPGADVRVYAQQGGNEVFRGLGAPGELVLDGRWEAFTGSEVVLSIAGDEFREGLQTRTFRQRVVVEPHHLHRVEVRSLDRWRTGAVVGGLALGVAWFVHSHFRVDEPGTPGRPPQNGEL